MIGVFVQLNLESYRAAINPVGYVLDGNGCWEWIGAKRQGYGQFWRNKRLMLAHRAVYEMMVGPIPDGMTLDHLCRNRSCVNPSHIEPVTLVENVLRGEGFYAQNARKTHCPKGHALTEGNLVPSQSRSGGRKCLTCSREHYHQNKEKCLEAQRRRYAENPEKFRSRSREYRAKDPAKWRALNKAWRDAHRDELNARRRKNRQQPQPEE